MTAGFVTVPDARAYWLCNATVPATLLTDLTAGVSVSADGLALIGAVVAEFVAGTGGTQSGLAYRVLESGYTMQIPRMFAALFMITCTGILIFVALSGLSHLALRKWHESAVAREG